METGSRRVFAYREGKSASGTVVNSSDIHAKKLSQLAHKAAATCRGGVLSSHVFFEAYDSLRKPAAVSSETRATEKQCLCEVTQTLTGKCDEADSLTESSGNRGEHGQKEQEDISQNKALVDLLNMDRFDMLELPKTDRKWKKVSKAVKEKTVVAAAAAKTHVESIDPNDLLGFYFSTYRTPIWLVPCPLTHIWHTSVKTWSLSVRKCCLTCVVQARILAGA